MKRNPREAPIRIRAVARIVRELMRGNDTPGKRLEALWRIAQQLVPGYRLMWPDPDWWKNESFNDYLRAHGEIDGFNTHKRWMLSQLLRLTEAVPGDTAECGVYKGSTSFLICRDNARSRQTRHHFMFDSFEGISQPGEHDGGYWAEGDLATAREVAERTLARFDDKTFLVGWIPSRFDEVSDRRFSFVHLDVDLHDPTRDGIEFFYDRLNDGGVLLCDDYGSEFCPGTTRACDEFLADKPEKMIALSPGGGFFIRGLATAAEPQSDAAP